MNLNELLVIIHAKNSVLKLRRLLTSIAEHKQLQQCPVLIVDDSYTPETVENNQITVANMHNLRTLYVSVDVWEQIKERSVLPQLTSHNTHTELVRDISLGHFHWNTPDVRNTGLLVSSLLYPDARYLINFDDDIVVSSKFQLRSEHFEHLVGMKIVGCPDFSRLNWIQFYARYICKKIGMEPFTIQPEYADHVVNLLTVEQMTLTIRRFSNLFAERLSVDAETETETETETNTRMYLPTREELSGGGYITTVANGRTHMFPPWYNEDWMWFNLVRSTSQQAHFVDQHIIHASSPKQVLNRQLLELEEAGEVFLKLFEEKLPSDQENLTAVEEFLNKRKVLIEREIQLVSTVEANVRDPLERQQLKQITRYLQIIDLFLEAQRPTAYVNLFKMFQQRNNLWKELMTKLTPISTPQLLTSPLQIFN